MLLAWYADSAASLACCQFGGPLGHSGLKLQIGLSQSLLRLLKGADIANDGGEILDLPRWQTDGPESTGKREFPRPGG